MPAFSFKIGGVLFQIKSDLRISLFNGKKFDYFSFQTKKPDVIFYFSGIAQDKLILTPLNAEEKKFLSNFFRPKYIGRGVLVIPPIIELNEFVLDELPENLKKSDTPLLQSRIVRSRIFSNRQSCSNISLSLHKLSIEIHNFNKSESHIYFFQKRKHLLEAMSFENGIRRLFSFFFPSFNAVMLHCSGIILKSKALLFFAPDEGGKTTVLNSAKFGKKLSDDRNIVRQIDNRIIAFSTPWGSLNTKPNSAELGAIIILEKYCSFELLSMNKNDALQIIWNEHFQNWHVLPLQSRKAAFNLVSDICKNTPTYKMRFTKNFIDWKSILSAIQKFPPKDSEK